MAASTTSVVMVMPAVAPIATIQTQCLLDCTYRQVHLLVIIAACRQPLAL